MNLDLKSKPFGLRLLAAVLIVLAAAWVRVTFLGELGLSAPYITFYPAAALAALFGGLLPGLTATIFSAALVSWFWLSPLGTFFTKSKVDLLAMGVFVASCALVSAIAEALHRAQRRVAEAEAKTRSDSAKQESEERYRRLFSAIPDPVAIVRFADKRFMEVNEAFLAFLELPRSQVAGRTSLEMGIWPDEAEFNRYYEDLCKAKGTLRDYETRLKTSSGEVRTVLLAVDTFEMEGARYALSLIKDITGRKQAESALRESEARLDLALDSGGMGMWEWDVRRNTSRWNAKEYELLGLPPGTGEVTTDSFFSYVCPDDLPALRRGLEALMREGSFWEDEFRITLPSGELRWLRGVGRLQRDASGLPTRMIGVNYDITERKQAGDALLESEHRFRELFDLCPVPLGFMSRDGRILDVNARFTQTFGYTLEDIPTLDRWRELAYPDPQYRATVTGLWDTVLSPTEGELGDIPTAEYRVTCKNGQTRTVLIAGKAIREGILSSIFDITPLKLLEERLKLSKEEADHANQAKSRFLATMSHEIRTPLSGLLGMTELAFQADTLEQARRHLSLAKQSGGRLLGLINDILDLSKIESGKTQIQNNPFRLDECVRTTLAPLSQLAKAKGVALYNSVGPGLPETLMGDQGRLQQIITNLVGNAVKFTPGGGEVWITAALDAKQPGPGAVRLLFTVRDSGIGIAPDRLGEVFDAFSQAGLETSPTYGGTGLGLSISKNLVELMEGRLWAESEPGRGSSFFFTARFGLLKAKSEPARTDGAALAGQPSSARRLKLLVAEDDPVNQEVAVWYLRGKGHDVTAVGNGRDALEALGAEPFDAVLMDIWMPVMDGIEAARRIRGNQAAGVDPDIPIIATTAYALMGDRERFLAAGMDYHLAKPLDLKELDQILMGIAAKRENPSAPGQ